MDVGKLLYKLVKGTPLCRRHTMCVYVCAICLSFSQQLLLDLRTLFCVKSFAITLCECCVLTVRCIKATLLNSLHAQLRHFVSVNCSNDTVTQEQVSPLNFILHVQSLTLVDVLQRKMSFSIPFFLKKYKKLSILNNVHHYSAK